MILIFQQHIASAYCAGSTSLQLTIETLRKGVDGEIDPGASLYLSSLHLRSLSLGQVFVNLVQNFFFSLIISFH